MPSGAPAPVGQYLYAYSPEAHDGRGQAEFTDRLDEALLFADFTQAHEAWTWVPANRPVREDGQPNRPLTAFTMEFLPVRLDEQGRAHLIEP